MDAKYDYYVFSNREVVSIHAPVMDAKNYMRLVVKSYLFQSTRP